jgi:hypothetical protein
MRVVPSDAGSIPAASTNLRQGFGWQAGDVKKTAHTTGLSSTSSKIGEASDVDFDEPTVSSR